MEKEDKSLSYQAVKPVRFGGMVGGRKREVFG
jgi:hypothetical protein